MCRAAVQNWPRRGEALTWAWVIQLLVGWLMGNKWLKSSLYTYFIILFIYFHFIPVLFSPALVLRFLFNHKAMCYSGYYFCGEIVLFILFVNSKALLLYEQCRYGNENVKSQAPSTMHHKYMTLNNKTHLKNNKNSARRTECKIMLQEQRASNGGKVNYLHVSKNK